MHVESKATWPVHCPKWWKVKPKKFDLRNPRNGYKSKESQGSCRSKRLICLKAVAKLAVDKFAVIKFAVDKLAVEKFAVGQKSC